MNNNDTANLDVNSVGKQPETVVESIQSQAEASQTQADAPKRWTDEPLPEIVPKAPTERQLKKIEEELARLTATPIGELLMASVITSVWLGAWAKWRLIQLSDFDSSVKEVFYNALLLELNDMQSGTVRPFSETAMLRQIHERLLTPLTEDIESRTTAMEKSEVQEEESADSKD